MIGEGITIRQAEALFLKEIQALGAIRYSLFEGSYRGEKKEYGEHMQVDFPANFRMTRCIRKKVYRLVQKFYGPCKDPVMRRGTSRRASENFRTRTMVLIFKEILK